MVQTKFADGILAFLAYADRFFGTFQTTSVTGIRATANGFHRVRRTTGHFRFNGCQAQDRVIVNDCTAFAFHFFTGFIASRHIFTIRRRQLPRFTRLLHAFRRLPIICVARIIISATVTANHGRTFRTSGTRFVRLVRAISIMERRTARLYHVSDRLTFDNVRLRFG